MSKRATIITIFTVLILALVGFIIYRQIAAPNNLLGGDRDAHGCIGSAGYSWCEAKNKCLRIWEESCESSSATSTLSEAEARTIAEATCIKGGEALASGGTYNDNSKTWWFDANLNSTPEGCNPACVVSEETSQAEINWRCTGLIVPGESAESIRTLLVAKYPKYAETLSVSVDQETQNFARGSVTFKAGMPGGIFLGAKVDGTWQLVFDGNGQIPCNLSSYGFPEEMLADCAE